MAPTNALLVALMFVTLLTIGIGNILSAIASFFDHRIELKLDWIHATWIMILLLIHLNLFWHALVLLEQEQWVFGWFLYILVGPMLLFVASQLILAEPGEDVPNYSRAHYLGVATRLFSVLALLSVWVVGLDVFLGDGIKSDTAWNLVGIVLFVILAVWKHERVHASLTVVTGILIILMFALRGAEVVA